MPRTRITTDDILDGDVELVDISTQALTDLENTAKFDPTGTDLTETEIGPAIRELSTLAGASASPGFSFGRSANVGANSWLLITGSVPSNKTGVPVAIQGAELTLVSVGNEDISTFDVTIYEHEGGEVNLTSLVTVSVVASRTGNFSVSVPVTTGRQLAARVTSGSAKNVGVSLQLKGSTS